jgi:hypothetical protein
MMPLCSCFFASFCSSFPFAPRISLNLHSSLQLTSGTTWHAAGLMVTYGSLSETSTEWRKYTKELYARELEAETVSKS